MRAATRVLSVALIVLGVTMVAVTAANGGGALAVGYLVGIGMAAAGVLRLYLSLCGFAAKR
jgi:hypothetical protein